MCKYRMVNAVFVNVQNHPIFRLQYNNPAVIVSCLIFTSDTS